MTASAPTGRNALLSVVIPVYGVESFLGSCLDSVLADGTADLEVVAVDDASPDGCPALLDRYADADPRVRVLHLEANVGLGRARNAGLDRATGDYVWFVDGDDTLPPGSVDAVLTALRAHRPDVLLIDHLRVYDRDGRSETDPSGRILRGITAAGPLSGAPELLEFQHAAWNKVVRRAHLVERGLRFHPGWYEDCAFSHPLLVGAGTIAALDRVCYHYRQRVTGGITRTVSRRHFDVFDQYERVFAELDRIGPAAEPFRARLFRLMVDHYLVIVGNHSRLPERDRADFFHRAAGHFRRYRPADGYPTPGGLAGLKHRFLATDAYWAYAALRRAYRLAGARGGAAPADGPEAGAATAPPTADGGRQSRVRAQ
ncbi:glycosyltransferase family 2 protein [Plantactinospora siamensis]|uniref:Glycosyltransferase family 2 protein n=1 Tax=Plantactinospora siamensis TaxID=555372 RepID=A0ABV6P4R5_9ACTN